MKIVVAGGTGFLGRALVAHLAGRGHEIVVLSRRGGGGQPTAARVVAWDPDGSAPTAGAIESNWLGEIEGAGAVINLAGAGIADKRWTAARKQQLRASRVLSTRSLVRAIRAATRRPEVFIQASGVNFYGTDGDETLDESFPPGTGLLSEICVAWEAEAHAATALNCRLVILRAGVALARDGGALKKIALPFRWFIGGPIASGRQYLSWIHRDDWMAMVAWVLETASLSGTFNATAPTPVTNAEFSKALGRALGRPSWLRVPAVALRLLVGEMADEMLINGQHVVPKRAIEAGFKFAYPTIEAALAAAV